MTHPARSNSLPRDGSLTRMGALYARASARQPLVLALVGVALLALTLVARSGEAPWYGAEGWTDRTRVTVSQQQIGETLREFPVYVDLGGLSAGFWQSVSPDCGDIRVTTSDGQTELARQVVSCDTAARTGALLLLAPSLSSRSDTGFYLYHGNPDVTDYASSHRYGGDALAAYTPGEGGAASGSTVEARR